MSVSRPSTGFSPDTATALGQADRGIRSRMGNHHALFDYWRFAMSTLCSVNAFYVGFYREGRKIVYPYTFDDTLPTEKYIWPEVFPYGPKGQAAWILQHRRPYLFSMDGGLLLRNGVAFGDERRMSADAVTIPIFDTPAPGSAVIGVASIQTYKPHSYTDEHVRAFEWTAHSVATVLSREREDDLNRAELAVPDLTSESERLSVVEVVQDVSESLRELHRGICRIEESVPVTQPELARMVTALRQRCEQFQTETMDIIARPTVHAETLLNSLSSKEREIALLIARGGMTNKEIAAQVFVTESTIKGHVSRILRKLGVEQRSGIATKLAEFTE
ncbi:helix-turn-helix transcriptional regulator [Sphaerisporangium aureirubrum]|uniref:LuxR C-terminal-related transcriptional regulator n=1 Tax=Sphaerisporangium aureirubrum TaxID=1544736 RepID=A0ABW1NNT1_9ACTN